MFKFRIEFQGDAVSLEASLAIKLKDADIEDIDSEDEDNISEACDEKALEIAEEIFQSIDVIPQIGDYYNDAVCINISGDFEFDDSDLELKSEDNSIYFFEYDGYLQPIDGCLEIEIDKSLIEERLKDKLEDDLEEIDEEDWEETAQELAKERAEEILEDIELDSDYSYYEQIYQGCNQKQLPLCRWAGVSA